jgi:hypothetical protein
VVHHGALGSWRRFTFRRGPTARRRASRPPAGGRGVDVATECGRSLRRFEFAAGSASAIVVVISTIHKVARHRARKHDLSGLSRTAALAWRAHEQVVPMIANRAVTVVPGHQLRNFDCSMWR